MASETLTLQFLHKAAAALPSANRTQMLLKSYLLTRSSATTNTQYVTAQRSTPDDGTACRKCCTPWQEASFALAVQPRRNHCRRARALVQRHESHANGLSACEQILAKKYLKSTSSMMKSECDLCHTVRRTIIRHRAANARTKKKTKAEPIADAPAVAANPTIDLSNVQLVRKKKRKSDPNAGLRIPVTCKSTANVTTPIVARVKHTTSIVSTTKTTPTPAAGILAPKAQKPLHKQQKPPAPNQVSNHKHKAKGTKATAQQSKGIKALSATAKKAAEAKQRNSMLLLANVLKMQDAAVKRPSGLEAMLRK